MFAEVILPLPLPGVFTYRVPSEWEAHVVSGSLVSVPFGKNKGLSGIVYRTQTAEPEPVEGVRPIEGVMSAEPVVRPSQFAFWEWIAQYYFCSLGEVSRNVLPAIVRSKAKSPAGARRRQRRAPLPPTQELHALNDAQQEAYDRMVETFRDKNVCLLHGVTSSGKTEIYTHLIRDTLRAGRQVLYLLPEIALTTQLTHRLQQFFGEGLGVFHSGISNGARIELWNRLLNGEEYPVVLGVRSSVFLPFRDLGLVIVDEEHESSYKQQDPAPRYHARNAAIVLAAQHRAKVVLGSATPSVESFHNAQSGKYGYVRLDKRFEDVALPTIVPVDVKELRRKKKMKSIFSPLLVERMEATLAAGKQIILFQNRRGFAPGMVCKICDWTPKCRYCDVSLTYHKHTGALTCHYCGRSYRLPQTCPECGSTDRQAIGYGTEKVEEAIRALFPDRTVARLDTDAAKSRRSLEKILGEFEDGTTQILIGTQMISKGLHFDHVHLVGILNADALMNFPDFRAYERAYQLMSQVAGRAGRRELPGEVVLQTSHPEHPLIQSVLQQDYQEMYARQMEERTLFRYPPFFRLIEITLKHREEAVALAFADAYAAVLREKLGDRVIGPDRPAVGRVQNRYLRKIWLKIEVTASTAAVKEIVEQAQAQVQGMGNSGFRAVTVRYDVDPVHG
jgi:primosomal protein N' (replication factor Y)